MKKQDKNFTGITQYNGNMPFAVHADSVGRVFIYKQIEYFSSKSVAKIFKGEDNSSILTELRNDGIKSNKYCFIGNEVFYFETQEKIIDFFSPIGNSNVPYPYAESKNYYYILLDKVCITKPKNGTKINSFDVYSYYYSNKKSKDTKKMKTKKVKLS